MNYDQKIIEEAKSQINFGLRQLSSVTSDFPCKVAYGGRLAEMVDEATAQKLYEEVILELERASGMKINRVDDME